MNLPEIKELTRVRVLGLLREPEAVFWVFAFPIILAAVLGFAFRSAGVKPSTIGLIEPASQMLTQALESDEQIDLETYPSWDEGFKQLRKGAVDGLIMEGGEADDPPRLAYDEARAEATTARLRVQRALTLAKSPGTDAPIDLEPVTETGSRYIDFLFPGLIGMNLMGTGMWGVGFAIADIRRKKFLRRLLVTPMRKSSFLLSFINSRLVFLFLELILLTSFGVWVLGIPFRGGLIAYLLICLLGAMLFSGLGILVASRARTIEGVSGIMNLVMMPMWLASGVFFSYERFPDWLHPILQLLPLTAVNDALRAVMLDGESLATQIPELIVMGVWAILCFVVALKIFRWE